MNDVFQGAKLTHGNQLCLDLSVEDLAMAPRAIKKSLGGALASVFAAEEGGGTALYHVYALRLAGRYLIVRCWSKIASFPAVSPELQAATWFEREARELFDVDFVGQLDARPLALHPESWPEGIHPMQKSFAWDRRVNEASGKPFPYQQVQGDGIFEIAVGPVHAGVIEPGHFRFSVAGEPIIALEPRLFYAHKGIEKLFEGRSPFSSVALAERISGDESVAFALAYVQSIENICGIRASPRADALRGIFAELERISMHLFDIGNICVGVAFNVGGAAFWHLKESLMRECLRAFGSRFLRNLVVPGGVSRDLAPDSAARLRDLLQKIKGEAKTLVAIMENSSSILDRLKETGPLARDVAEDLGAVGVVARASGVNFDARAHLPYSIYRTHQPRVALQPDGDAYSRTRVRVAELRESIRFICDLLDRLPEGPEARPPLATLPLKDGSALGWAEAPRGNAVVWARIENGLLARVHVSSPSFLNWPCMAHAIKGMIVADFPILNKSFGLSYSGCDR
jgi:Ni,Fe-hydrogenase III large subunit/Ni,Fe-hydrogenase III component G